MTAIIHLLLVCVVAQVGQTLRCNSPLRPYLPQFFTHCCVYSEWSEWTYVAGSEVADPACPSGESHNVTRFRNLTGLPWGCEESETETHVNCTSKADILIRYLGLGADGTQNLQPTGTNNFHRRSAARCPSITGEHGYLCLNLYRTIGRRSTAMEKYLEKSSNKENTRRNLNVTPSDLNPVRFVQKDDHTLFRRHAYDQTRRCRQDDIQYILFLIDTSGSIGRSSFNRVTEAIGNITAFFCRQIRVAVMTFNHHFRLEFCFNCYDNDQRSSISQAIKNVQYREGLSYTAAAARCACMELLNESCGLPQDAECIDVVFITDGHPNDPFLQVCEEVRCLHERALNTYAITVGNPDDDAIQCITQQDNEVHILFDLGDIDEVVSTFEEAVSILQLSSGLYSCINNAGFPDSGY